MCAQVADFIDDSAAATPGNRYAVLYFDSDTSPVFSLAPNADGAADTVRSTPRMGSGSTSFSSPLGGLSSALSDASRPRVALLVTDGSPTTESDAQAAASAEALKGEGITLVTVGVGSGTDEEFLRSIASEGPDGTPYFFETLDFDDAAVRSAHAPRCVLRTSSCALPRCGRRVTGSVPGPACAHTHVADPLTGRVAPHAGAQPSHHDTVWGSSTLSSAA